MPYAEDNGHRFRCPICRSRYFSPVRVKRPDGRIYETDFFECSGCSVMFRDSMRFTQFEPYEPKPATAAHKRQEADRVTYFEAHSRQKR